MAIKIAENLVLKDFFPDNHLTVIALDTTAETAIKIKQKGEKIRKIRWICKCDCGTVMLGVKESSLKQGFPKSCGCIRAAQLKSRHAAGLMHVEKPSVIGEVTGMLYIKAHADDYVLPSKARIKMYDCVCACGNRATYSRAHLIKNEVRSCGCLKHTTRLQAWDAPIQPEWLRMQSEHYEEAHTAIAEIARNNGVSALWRYDAAYADGRSGNTVSFCVDTDEKKKLAKFTTGLEAAFGCKINLAVRSQLDVDSPYTRQILACLENPDNLIFKA